jgi:hypothetical protein
VHRQEGLPQGRLLLQPGNHTVEVDGRTLLPGDTGTPPTAFRHH